MQPYQDLGYSGKHCRTDEMAEGLGTSISPLSGRQVYLRSPSQEEYRIWPQAQSHSAKQKHSTDVSKSANHMYTVHMALSRFEHH